MAFIAIDKSGILAIRTGIYRFKILCVNTEALNKIEAEVADSEEKRVIVEFIKSSDRGIVKGK